MGGEVDDVEVGGGEAVAEETGHEAGAGAELADDFSAGRDEIERPAVEGVAAGDEFGAVEIVGGGGGVEDFQGEVGHVMISCTNHKQNKLSFQFI